MAGLRQAVNEGSTESFAAAFEAKQQAAAGEQSEEIP
jgi:hypothetical protein